MPSRPALTPEQLDRIARAETLPEGVQVYRHEPAAFVLTCSICQPGRWFSCAICPDRPDPVLSTWRSTTTGGSQP